MNKHEPAFPANVTVTKDGVPCGTECFKGLSKYEEVAARFMAAQISTGDEYGDTLAKASFNYADAFFAELEKRGAK